MSFFTIRVNRQNSRFLLFLLIIIAISACKKEDKTAPIIELIGKDSIYLNLNDVWLEPGYTATDKEDGDITSDVVVSGGVNSHYVSIYYLKYSVSDAAGNETIKDRVVIVKADSLQGHYFVNAHIEGVNQGNYTYNVSVTPESEYNTLQISNFAGLGAQVKVTLIVDGTVIMIPAQSPANVNPGYEGTLTGLGTYDGATKKILQLNYTMNYNAGGTDNGSATFVKN